MRLYSALGYEGSFGWGVLTHHLHRALAARCELHPFPPNAVLSDPVRNDGHALVAVVGEDLRPVSPLRGLCTHGLGLFDHPLDAAFAERARRYDRLFVGSTWCADHLRRAGVAHAVPFVQGVDTALFQPPPDGAPELLPGSFVIFSGGKLEYRKGQDLAIAAVRVLQERYADVVFVTLWGNYLGADSLRTIAASPHIRFELKGESPEAWGHHLCAMNGLDPGRTICLGETPHTSLPEVYRNTHIGLFPNRCEAATNLVMAEYLACGRPVVASHQFGQKDILGRDYAFLLEPRNRLDTLEAEPAVEEIVEALDFAYHHREILPSLGRKGAEAMRRFTWDAAAATLLEAMAEAEKEKSRSPAK